MSRQPRKPSSFLTVTMLRTRRSWTSWLQRRKLARLHRESRRAENLRLLLAWQELQVRLLEQELHPQLVVTLEPEPEPESEPQDLATPEVLPLVERVLQTAPGLEEPPEDPMQAIRRELGLTQQP